jgi:hypothetical protein
MYKVEFLPIAKKDMDEIIYYVSNNLKNLSAARDLANSFMESVSSILVFPFGIPTYKTSKNNYYCKNFVSENGYK